MESPPSSSDSIWRAITYGLHTIGSLYFTGALRDIARVQTIVNAPVCNDISKLDLSKRTGILKIVGTIGSPRPISTSLSLAPVVVLSQVHTGRFVSYYGSIREMFLKQDVRVAPFYLARPNVDPSNAENDAVWITRNVTSSVPRFFCPNLLSTVSEKVELIRPFAGSFIASLLGFRLPFEEIQRVSVLPVDCEALIISSIERESSSSRIRLSRTPWWSLFPPDVTVVTTSSAEDIVDDFRSRAVERTLTATGFFTLGLLSHYLRTHQ